MNFKSQNFFLLRRSAFPVNTLLDLQNKAGNDPTTFEKQLIEFFVQPQMLEVLYVASPELYEAFIGVLAGTYQTGIDKLLRTLHKYLIRMTTRSTPYGLFAGCTMGSQGSETRIVFNEQNPCRFHSRLDMNYVAEMTTDIISNETIKKQLKFFPNTSLYLIGEGYRYIESTVKNKKRNYLLASVENSPYLQKILTKAAQGSTFQELVEELISDEFSLEEIENYVNSIIDSQILVSELEPTTTGDEFFDVLIERLKKLQHTDEINQNLLKIKELLRTNDRGIKKYQEIQEIISKNFTTTNSKDLVQTDMFFETEACSLSDAFVNTLSKDLKNIMPLGLSYYNADMATFKTKFYERYEEQEMPLLSVIDNETGIGYGNVTSNKADNLPMLENLALPANFRADSTEWTALARLKYKLYQEAIAKGQSVIQLTDQLINSFKESNAIEPSLTKGFYIFGSLIASSVEEVDKGNFKFNLYTMTGSSGIKLLGRFGHGNQELTEKMREAAKLEDSQYSDTIYAEIAHLPEARVGNILMRPHLRPYEIPYLAGSDVPQEYQITPDDLMVSIRGEEVVLRSKRLNKRVFPRRSNAHNTVNGLPVYKFLCDLENQELQHLYGWSWGFLNDHPFLPRVEYRHLILGRATWNIKKDNYPALQQKNCDLKEELRKIREQLQLPRYVQLSEGDNELLIDFECDFSVQILADALKKYDRIKLVEFIGLEDECFVKTSEGYFTNEILIPMLKETEATSKAVPLAPKPSPVKRNFITGSEWLYIKIYTGTKTADKILTGVIKPFAEEMLQKGIIEQWFFIRYGDPDEHIRVRFNHNTKPDFWYIVLQELNTLMQPYIDKGIVTKFQTDTYKREIERYGDSTIELVERVFCADSKAIVGFLDLLEGDEGERYRWLVALRGVDMLLNDFGYNLADKKNIMELMRENFFKEFNGNTSLNKQLNDKYRTHTADIESFLKPEDDEKNQLSETIALFEERSVLIGQIKDEILARLQVDKNRLLSSLVHMFLNRMFISKQRVHELVVYHYLKKYYESALARAKNTNKMPV
ncbi:lantibiotic dehydratase [Emticicia sp. 17c]|uniref:lantibiotic dehydratase n=1 Tax=Emticicia sp. 17c TaxID=3127704 RepID=UPI00301CD9B5